MTGDLDRHQEQLGMAGMVVEQCQSLGHDLERGGKAAYLLGVGDAPGQLVVAHRGLVDAGDLSDLLLRQAALRPEPSELIREAVLLAVFR